MNRSSRQSPRPCHPQLHNVHFGSLRLLYRLQPLPLHLCHAQSMLCRNSVRFPRNRPRCSLCLPTARPLGAINPVNSPAAHDVGATALAQSQNHTQHRPVAYQTSGPVPSATHAFNSNLPGRAFQFSEPCSNFNPTGSRRLESAVKYACEFVYPYPVGKFVCHWLAC